MKEGIEHTAHRMQHIGSGVTDQCGRHGAAKHKPEARQADENNVIVSGAGNGKSQQADTGAETNERTE